MFGLSFVSGETNFILALNFGFILRDVLYIRCLQEKPQLLIQIVMLLSSLFSKTNLAPKLRDKEARTTCNLIIMFYLQFRPEPKSTILYFKVTVKMFILMPKEVDFRAN